MQLGEWRKTAPNRECMSNAVFNVLKPVLTDLGASADPDCWVQWGEDPEIRYLVMVPTRAGLISTAVRVNTGPDGPRATGKLIRWARLQMSELSVESAAGHRVVAVQVEGQVLKGTDGDADRICEFVRGLIAAVDGRDWQFSWDGAPSQPQPRASQRSASSKGFAAKPGARAGTRLGAKPAAKPAPEAGLSRSAAKSSPAPRSASAKGSASAPKPATPKPAAKPPNRATAGSAVKPASPKRTNTTALPALGPGAPTHQVLEPEPLELTRIAPHPIFAPVSTPPARGAEGESEDWGDADSDDRTDLETRRPKTWTP
jgi:hypothetical protein